MPCQRGIFSRRNLKRIKITLEESSRGIYIFPSSDNTPSSTPSGTSSKRKAPPEEKCDDELPEGIGDDYYFYPLDIDGDLNMGDMSVGNCYMKSHYFYQQDQGTNNGNTSSVNGLINIRTLYKCNYSSTFKDIYGDVENCDVSSGNGSINRNTVYQHNGLKLLINNNNMDHIKMNDDLKIVM